MNAEPKKKIIGAVVIGGIVDFLIIAASLSTGFINQENGALIMVGALVITGAVTAGAVVIFAKMAQPSARCNKCNKVQTVTGTASNAPHCRFCGAFLPAN